MEIIVGNHLIFQEKVEFHGRGEHSDIVGDSELSCIF